MFRGSLSHRHGALNCTQNIRLIFLSPECSKIAEHFQQ